MKLFLIIGIYLCVLIRPTSAAGITKNNDKLPEVETTVDGKFIITYPNIDGQPQQQQKQEQKNETSSSSPSKDETNHHPSLTQNPQTSITNLKDEKKPIMPNIGPLTAYGHPSTRYKSVDRDIETSSAASKESDGTETLTEKSNNDSESDSEPDPFVSQRKIRPVVVPDAYAAAPIVFKSRGDPFVFSTIQTTQTSAEKTTVIENVETFPTLISVQEPLETSILPTTTSSTTAPTTTIAPIHAVTAVKIQDISPIIVPLSSFSTSETTTLSSSTTTPTTTSPRIPIQDTAPSASSTVPLPTLATSQSTISSSSTVTITAPSVSDFASSSSKISPPTGATSKFPISNDANNSTPNNSETNETSAELLNKETFNNEASDYDNDVFARLKDDVELIGDNPRSSLSESFPRPTLVHPRKSNKFFRRRQFAAPSEDGNVENVEAEEEEDDEIIPEVAFPLPNCYRAAGGFLCCNRFLEELIYRSNTVIQKKQLSECNIHAFASHLQSEAEKMFKTTFEIIIGTGDFASKTRFKDNLICKTITNKKVILIYGTPEPYSLSQDNTPLAFI